MYMRDESWWKKKSFSIISCRSSSGAIKAEGFKKRKKKQFQTFGGNRNQNQKHR